MFYANWPSTRKLRSSLNKKAPQHPWLNCWIQVSFPLNSFKFALKNSKSNSQRRCRNLRRCCSLQDERGQIARLQETLLQRAHHLAGLPRRSVVDQRWLGHRSRSAGKFSFVSIVALAPMTAPEIQLPLYSLVLFFFLSLFVFLPHPPHLTPKTQLKLPPFPFAVNSRTFWHRIRPTKACMDRATAPQTVVHISKVIIVVEFTLVALLTQEKLHSNCVEIELVGNCFSSLSHFGNAAKPA